MIARVSCRSCLFLADSLAITNHSPAPTLPPNHKSHLTWLLPPSQTTNPWTAKSHGKQHETHSKGMDTPPRQEFSKADINRSSQSACRAHQRA
jgi:hypothetical protein